MGYHVKLTDLYGAKDWLDANKAVVEGTAPEKYYTTIDDETHIAIAIIEMFPTPFLAIAYDHKEMCRLLSRDDKRKKTWYRCSLKSLKASLNTLQFGRLSGL
jgi:hypothetical protein